MTEVVMPRMGYDMTEGKLLRWRKKEGEEVRRGEILAEIETSKVTIEIEAFGEGVVRGILVKEGETVPVGQVIAVIAPAGEEVAGARAPAALAAPAPPAVTAAAVAETAPPGVAEGAERILASPMARQMAQSHGIDLAKVGGTGPRGRVTKEDVEAYLQARAAPAAPAPASAGAAAPQAAPVAGPAEGYEDRDLSRMRQTIARRMTASKTSAPHFYVTADIDMTEAQRLRQQLTATAGEGVKVTVTDLLVRAAALALRRFPQMNVSFIDGKLRVHHRVNIGVAVAVEEGLITPCLPDCDRKSVLQIAREARALTERARANRLKPEDLTPATFTISNLGMFDVESFVAIINPPEAAILAVGSVEPRPVVADGQVRVSDRMKVTLSADHRAVDGALAARFLQGLKQILQNPLQLIL